MIPTNTSAKLSIVPAIPDAADGIVLFVAADQPPRGLEQLPSPEHDAANALAGAKALPTKANQAVIQVVAGRAYRRLIVIGLGESEKLSPQAIREAAASAAKQARKLKLRRLAIVSPHVLFHGRPMSPHEAIEMTVDALATGFLLGNYQYREWKGAFSRDGDDKPAGPLRVDLVVEENDSAMHQALASAVTVSEAQNLARTVASRPGNQINPPALAELCRQVARQVGLRCRVLDEKELKRLGMGGLLAVGSGSATPPRLIVLEHRPRAPRAKRPAAPIVLVGKSITFDTGGVSIKPADKMGDMVYDKCGGMAVLGTMVALTRSKHPGHVVGILTSAENHLSGTAYRPGDIIRLFNGVTVEITNTDAEGRLVLADALAWGIATYKPAAIVDLATLTGGVVTALGTTMAGLMSNDDDLAASLLEAANDAGEKAWRLPVGEEQREMMKSHHADIINAAGRAASPLTGAAFLTFALPDKPKVPWAHFDIAGVADTDKELPLYAKGATGWGVRTLVKWLGARS